MTAKRKAAPIPRAFRAWAKRTWGWQKGTIHRLQHEKPAVLAENIAYWRVATAPKPECPEGCIRVGRGRDERHVVECGACGGTGIDTDDSGPSPLEALPEAGSQTRSGRVCEECKGSGDVDCPNESHEQEEGS